MLLRVKESSSTLLSAALQSSGLSQLTPSVTSLCLILFSQGFPAGQRQTSSDLPDSAPGTAVQIRLQYKQSDRDVKRSYLLVRVDAGGSS